MGEKRQLWSQRHPLRMGREVAFSFYLCFRFLLIYLCVCVRVKSLQSCPTLCNPTNCSPPAASVHGISQARILKQIAISFSRGISPTRGSNPGLLVSCIGRRVLYHQRHHRGNNLPEITSRSLHLFELVLSTQILRVTNHKDIRTKDLKVFSTQYPSSG